MGIVGVGGCPFEAPACWRSSTAEPSAAETAAIITALRDPERLRRPGVVLSDGLVPKELTSRHYRMSQDVVRPRRPECRLVQEGRLRAWPAPLEQTPERPDERFWLSVREQFLMPPDLGVLNAATLCPSSAPVLEAMYRSTKDMDGDPSFDNRQKMSAGKEETRRQVGADGLARPCRHLSRCFACSIRWTFSSYDRGASCPVRGGYRPAP